MRGCVIFDFDGVIADTERLHLQAYNHALKLHAPKIGGELVIPPEAYFGRYIVYGNREGFFHMLRDAGLAHHEELLATLCAAKDELFEKGLGGFAEPLPGVRELLVWLEERVVPRAICSGAARKEITMLLDAFGLRHHFDVIVAIEDVRYGKPEPEGYNLAFDKLNLEYDAELDRAKSLVIEDSGGGCAAGKAAGIPVLGVAGSLSYEELRRCATYAVRSLAGLDHGQLAKWLGLASD